MKAMLLAVMAMLMVACTSSTEYGDCIGIGDDKNPALKYDVSTWNVVLGVVFVETIVVPVVVVTDKLYCPIGKR